MQPALPFLNDAQAAAHTPSGNLDLPEPSSNSSDLPYSVVVNDHDPLVWVIPYASSSSCVERSGISCYNLGHQFEFPANWLNAGSNTFKLALPYDRSGGDVNFRNYSVNVMYDSLRLEVGDGH
jgi:rhamnogalacturonan endolyase